MAAVLLVSGSSTAYGFTTPAGPKTATTESGGAGHLEMCFVAAAFSGTYVQGTGFSLTNAQVASAISSAKRDGGTITIVDVMSAAPGLEGTTSPAFVMAGPVTYAAIGNAVTGLLYGPDLATEHAAVAMLAFSSPIVFAVTFSSQAAL